MTASKKTQNNADEQELTECDLQLLLRSKLGEQVVVLQSTMSYLPPGDNFACRIAKIMASVKRNEDAPEEMLHFVAKLYPQAESIKAVFDFRKLFGKEIFCYEKLLPTFKQLASEFGVVEITCSDFAPKVINVRLSADPHAEKIDEGVVLLMENLNTLGYYTLDKIEGKFIHTNSIHLLRDLHWWEKDWYLKLMNFSRGKKIPFTKEFFADFCYETNHALFHAMIVVLYCSLFAFRQSSNQWVN